MPPSVPLPEEAEELRAHFKRIERLWRQLAREVGDVNRIFERYGLSVRIVPGDTVLDESTTEESRHSTP